GDGRFPDGTESGGQHSKGYVKGAAGGDYDNDGDPDVFVTNYGRSVLYRNNGDGTFSDGTSQARLTADGWARSAGFVDYGNGGNLDLFVCRYLQWSFASNIYCGNKVPNGRSYCHPDNFKPVSNLLFRNNGDGTFADVTQTSRIGESAGKGLGVAFDDFNGGGNLDMHVD